MQLGELEKLVLQHFWNVKEADAKQVHKVLGLARGNSLNTIQSTLDRLFKKELLKRTKQGHAYCYSARVDREGLIAQLISNVTSDFNDDGENSLIAAFSSASAQLNDEQLDTLEKMIEKQRQLRKERV